MASVWLSDEGGTVYFNISGLDGSHSYERNCWVIVTKLNSISTQEQDITIPAYSESYSYPLYSIAFEGGETYEYFVRLEYRSGGPDDAPEYSYVDFGTNTWYCPSSKPESFYWTVPKIKEKNVVITAAEWNSFTSCINRYRNYKGYGEVSFTKAISSGISGRNVATLANGLPPQALVSASAINDAIDAINPMVGYSLAKVNREERITAEVLNDMVEKLNSIS